jgi:hypothetical protein
MARCHNSASAEASETADLDLVACLQPLDDGIEDRPNSFPHVKLRLEARRAAIGPEEVGLHRAAFGLYMLPLVVGTEIPVLNLTRRSWEP